MLLIPWQIFFFFFKAWCYRFLETKYLKLHYLETKRNRCSIFLEAKGLMLEIVRDKLTSPFPSVRRLDIIGISRQKASCNWPYCPCRLNPLARLPGSPFSNSADDVFACPGVSLAADESRAPCDAMRVCENDPDFQILSARFVYSHGSSAREV